MYIFPMATATISEARAKLPELLNRVHDGEEITITRHGRAVAVLISPAVLRTRRAASELADAERVHELLAIARSTDLPLSGGLTEKRADELVAEMRAGRRAR